MEKLSEKIAILSVEEGDLLKADRLSSNRRNHTGLYLVCEPEHYVAFDFSDRQSWCDYFGSMKDAPQGWSKDFINPLDAIDWLISLKR